MHILFVYNRCDAGWEGDFCDKKIVEVPDVDIGMFFHIF